MTVMLVVSIFAMINADRVKGASSVYINSDSYSGDPFKSDITIPVIQNVTVPFADVVTVNAPPLTTPTVLTIDTARGFEPAERFSGEFNDTLARKSNVGNSTLTNTDTGLLLSFSVENRSEAGIAAYNLTLASPIQVWTTDFVSIAFSTTSEFNSSQAYVGVSLLLRDDSGNRRYLSFEASNQYRKESFEMSKWFLGWGFTTEFQEFPHYSFKYGSVSGSWFKQLNLSQAFANLNLSYAWLDGFLLGGEIFSTPIPYSLAQMNVTFNYVNIGAQFFSINGQMINSADMAFPYQKNLTFSGIVGKAVTIGIRGYLKSTSDREDRLENDTISRREVFYNLSQAYESGVITLGNINLTLFTRSVRNCSLTFDEISTIDLTDTLLSRNTVISTFPVDVRTVRVLLTLYRFNGWIFTLSSLSFAGVTKHGIMEEHFSTFNDEGDVIVEAAQAGENIHLALRVGGLTQVTLTINGVEKPLKSVAVINGDTYLMIPLDTPGQGSSQLLIKYMLGYGPIYQSATERPFNVYADSSFFSIYTPFNVEGELHDPIPLTVQMLTAKTYVLGIVCDPSFFETERTEIMAYASRAHFEYFMLTPLETGPSVVDFRITDPDAERTIFSASILTIVDDPLISNAVFYLLLIATLVSFGIAIWGSSLSKLLSSFRGRKSAGNLKLPKKVTSTLYILPPFQKRFSAILRFAALLLRISVQKPDA